jgi:arylsulfatase
VTLWAGDRQIGEGDIPRTISLIFTTYGGMDISRDNGGVVDLDYEDRAPYAFTGTVRNVVFDLAPHAHDVEVDLHGATAQAALAHGAAG